MDDRTLVSIMGRVHDFGDRRLRVPGAAGLVAAILGTAMLAWAGHLGVTVAGAIAVAALACWLIIYARISAPINSRLTACMPGGANAGRSPRPGPQRMRVRSGTGGHVSGEDVVRVAIQVLASWDRAPGRSTLRAGQAGNQKAARRRSLAGEECRPGGWR